MIMGPRHLLPVLLLLIALNTAKAQSAEELPPIEENDNLFPSESPSLGDDLEGSGNSELEASAFAGDLDTSTPVTLEDLEPTTDSVSTVSDTILCPEVCSCTTEGDGDSQILTANCANKDLLEIPSNLDPRITSLNVENNQLTAIPKMISEFKKLQVLTASHNLITDLAPGSVSELPELKTLNLDNNGLLEYPQELKNGFFLTKLQEINLGGNDIRMEIPVESFSIFEALKKLTVPAQADVNINQFCEYYTNSTLETICIDLCDSNSHDCPKPTNVELSTDNVGNTNWATVPSQQAEETTSQDDQSLTTPPVTQQQNDTNGFARTNFIIEAPIEPVDTPTEEDVSVGAATSSTTTGGVDKSLIAIIVAGMVVVVAAISIKRNWGSIRKRFSSNPPHPATESNGNGTTPEEVPLQEKNKSPV